MFIVPGLVLFGGIPIHVAIGASLISVVATSAGASAAFVRDGWTNLRVAMALEVATVSGAVIGASLAGVLQAPVLELIFAAMMLVSAYFALSKHGEQEVLNISDPLAERLKLGGVFPDGKGKQIPYGVRNLPGGAAIMVIAGLMSGLLGIGCGRAQGRGDGQRDGSAAQSIERDQQFHDWRHRRRGGAGVPVPR